MQRSGRFGSAWAATKQFFLTGLLVSPHNEGRCDPEGRPVIDALHSTSIAPLRAWVLSSLGTPHLLWLHDYPDPILIDDGRFQRRAHVHAASVSVADEHDRPL